jgi:hypothetical protein
LSVKRVSVKLLVFLAIASVIILATTIPVETMHPSLFGLGGVR